MRNEGEGSCHFLTETTAEENCIERLKREREMTEFRAMRGKESKKMRARRVAVGERITILSSSTAYREGQCNDRGNEPMERLSARPFLFEWGGLEARNIPRWGDD